MTDSASQCAVTLPDKGRHCKHPVVPGTGTCAQHQREPDPTEEDRLLILGTLAAPGVFSMPPHEICERILGTASRDGRTREHRQWLQRTLTLRGAEIELHDLGLIYEAVPADGLHSYEVRITEAGRGVLAQGTA